MEAAKRLAAITNWTRACLALGVSRVSAYRFFRRKDNPAPPSEATKSERALSDDERRRVLDVLNSERFADMPPAEVYATLLDEGVYLCSIRTMYPILEENQEVRERRNQASHVVHEKPELLATKPNELWSWDITKLKGAAKWTYFYLYVIMDVFSRYAVGWMVAHRESAASPSVRVEGCQTPDKRDDPKTAGRSEPAHHPCRPRLLDEVQVRGDALE